jgi:hypothetical protein
VHDKGEGSDRLRVGGWLPDTPETTGRALPGPPPVQALPAPVPPRAASTPAVYTAGRFTGLPRPRLVAAVVAAVALSITTVVWIAGGDEPENTPTSERRPPLWAGVPYDNWSLSPPEPWTEPAPPTVPSIPVADPGGGDAPAPAATTPRSPAAKPVVSLTDGPIPAVVDLSAEGTRDWVHWGLTDATSVNRRRGGKGIEDLGGTPRGRYDNNPQSYSWTGGSPAATAARTPTGVYSCGQGATITLRAPAGPATRTLHLYAGVWMASGRLTVTVDGVTATRTLENRDAISTRRFEVRYRAAAGSRLTVTWTATAAHHPTCGNIDLQAATLS